MWTKVLGNLSPLLLDPQTVDTLKLLAPKFSTSDAAKVRFAMDAGELFPHVEDPQLRASILGGVLQIEGRILSLSTFIEDTKYLEPCVSIMRSLLPKYPMSLEKAFRDIFTADESAITITLELEEDSWTTIRTNLPEAFQYAFKQLWLFLFCATIPGCRTRSALNTLAVVSIPDMSLNPSFVYSSRNWQRSWGSVPPK